MAENELVLKQRNSLGFNTQIKLIDGRELQVISKKKKINQSYSVDILSLNDKSKLTLYVAWKWLFFCAGIFLLTLLMLKILPLYLDNNKNLYLGIVLLSGFLGTIFCFVKFFKNTSKQQIFYSKKAQVPIIRLSSGKPSKEKFSTFINSVEQRIKKFQEHMNVPEDKQLVGEMKMLRRLSETDVISENAYNSAKKKLFSGFSD